eukprot:TRINITY_DN42832_c0_g2_i1.p1 TRINITY_DN42832_c0_g2~~TRINITY_DN42832_c0_g2_i1.p1  ORF type:complete len:270 (+),score=35.00 TRINITY_DN42832_c0_g2_i1:35-844(+)
MLALVQYCHSCQMWHGSECPAQAGFASGRAASQGVKAAPVWSDSGIPASFSKEANSDFDVSTTATWCSKQPSSKSWADWSEASDDELVYQNWHTGAFAVSSEAAGKKMQRIPVVKSRQLRMTPKPEEATRRDGGLQLTAPPAITCPFHYNFEWQSGFNDSVANDSFDDAGSNGNDAVDLGNDSDEVETEFNFDRTQSGLSFDDLPSVGSAGHGMGQCRPCAHYWREGGCNRGQLCQRCHLCTVGDFRDYRHALKTRKRTRRSNNRGGER